jgi:DNA-binding response OmpR family regulator
VRVLLVEDNSPIADAVAQVLQKNNYTVDIAADGVTGLDYAFAEIYDIIILDIMLPKKDGLTVLKEIRESGIATPVILLTARDGVEYKVAGLDQGADDFLAKPFHTAELLARMRALLRRKPTLEREGMVSLATTKLDPHSLMLSKDDISQKLTLKESQLLELLINNANRIISKYTIIEKLWGLEEYVEENRVETYVSLVRKKLVTVEADIEIQTVRGAGYVLREKQDY